MTISTDIRGALQTQAATATGFPASNQRAYEAAEFAPTNGTPWARMTIEPVSGRPFPLSGSTREHRGLFIVTVFIPTDGGEGTAEAEIAADEVRNVFAPFLKLSAGSDQIVIEYSERRAAVIEPDWISVPVFVGWVCRSPRA